MYWKESEKVTVVNVFTKSIKFNNEKRKESELAERWNSKSFYIEMP